MSRARDSTLLGPRSIHRAIDRLENAARMLEEHAARFEQRHAARRAGKERRPQLVLEGTNLPADWWLGNVQALGGTPHVSFLGDSHEIADLRQAHEHDPDAAPSANQGAFARSFETKTVLDPERAKWSEEPEWPSKS